MLHFHCSFSVFMQQTIVAMTPGLSYVDIKEQCVAVVSYGKLSHKVSVLIFYIVQTHT